jgi:membrane protease YdiL (CAAX protease family)
MTTTVPAVDGDPPLAGEAQFAQRQALRSVAWFTALCLALALAGVALTSSSPQLVPFILALGPAVIALSIAVVEGQGSLGRLVSFLWKRPVDRRMYLLVALPIGWALATVAVGVLIGQSQQDLFPDLLPSLVIVPLVVLVPAFAEELAWRGFAVPRLMPVVSPFVANLVLAVPWTVMHLPLMLPGGINEGAALWPTILSLASYSIVLTWIFVRTGGSVLLTGLVHAGFNGVVPLMRGIDADAAWAIRAVLAALVALAIVVLGGFEVRRPASDRPEALTTG